MACYLARAQERHRSVGIGGLPGGNDDQVRFEASSDRRHPAEFPLVPLGARSVERHREAVADARPARGGLRLQFRPDAPSSRWVALLYDRQNATGALESGAGERIPSIIAAEPPPAIHSLRTSVPPVFRF